jgi:hypothetical protein
MSSRIGGSTGVVALEKLDIRGCGSEIVCVTGVVGFVRSANGSDVCEGNCCIDDEGGREAASFLTPLSIALWGSETPDGAEAGAGGSWPWYWRPCCDGRRYSIDGLEVFGVNVDDVE